LGIEIYFAGSISYFNSRLSRGVLGMPNSQPNLPTT
jgi:hypothetical protein